MWSFMQQESTGIQSSAIMHWTSATLFTIPFPEGAFIWDQFKIRIVEIMQVSVCLGTILWNTWISFPLFCFQEQKRGKNMILIPDWSQMNVPLIEFFISPWLICTHQWLALLWFAKALDWWRICSRVVGLNKGWDILSAIYHLKHVLYIFQSLHTLNYLQKN